MHLVIFDIDGTLTRTVGVDDACFARAVRDVLGLSSFDPDWSTYRHVTDTGLVSEVVARATGTPATTDQIARVRARFVELLADHARHEPASFAPLAGALGAIETLRTLPDHRVALATGSWHASAIIKLRTSGLTDLLDLPLGTSDDAISRFDVVRSAAARALGHTITPANTGPDWPSLRNNFSSVVCLGDGVWDARTAHELGAGFIAVRSDGDFARFVPFNTRHHLRDYTPSGGAANWPLLLITARITSPIAPAHPHTP